MKKHMLILTAAVTTVLTSSAGAVASADENPLGLPLIVPQVAEGSFEGTDQVFGPTPPRISESASR